MAKQSSRILELARLGAKVRIRELAAEIESIRREFPGEFGLRGGAKKPRVKSAAAARRRRPMSPVARKAVSERMKKYWAAKQKAKAQK